MLRKLERALENGYTILIENIGESLDAVLNPVIQRAVIKRGKKMYIKLGTFIIYYCLKYVGCTVCMRRLIDWLLIIYCSACTVYISNF
jgi:hypothetical protein